MVTILSDAPAQTAAFEATGQVTADDYKTVVIPEIDRVVAQYDKIRFLLVLRTNVANFDMMAWANDIGVGIKHLTKWHKMAIVSDQDWVNKASDLVGNIMPGEVKSFKLAELDAAKSWVAA